MKKFIAGVLAFSMLVSSSCFSFVVQADEESTERKTYIVRLSQPPVYEASDDEDGLTAYSLDDANTRLMRVQSEQNAFKASVSKSTDSDIIYQYDQVFNGMAVEATEEEIKTIKEMPNVTGVYESESIEIEPVESDETTSDDEEFYDLGKNINADALREEMEELQENSGEGEGMVIAVVDTEFDVNHEAYSLTNTSNLKITKKDIGSLLDGLSIGNLTTNRVYVNDKIPFAFNYVNKNKDVYDYNSAGIHGSHVAGIAAGNSDVLKGIAPNAQLVLMKCADDSGVLKTDALIAAINDAVKMKVDVINYSIGIAYANVYSNAYYEVLRNVSATSTEIFIAAGNSGMGLNNANKAYTSEVSFDTGGGWSGSPDVPSVGNAYSDYYDSTYMKMNIYNDSDENETIFYIDGGGSDFTGAFSDKEYEIADVGVGNEEDFDKADVEGKIVLVKYNGTYSSSVLKQRILEYYGIGMIFVSNSYGSIHTMGEFPAAIVIEDDYEKLQKAKYIQTTGEKEVVYNKQAMASTSSYTINEYLDGGVQLSARGTGVMSSVPDDEYQSFNGTSMASPMAAGAYALVKSYFKNKYTDMDSDTADFTTFCINMMQNTADIIDDPNADDNAPYPARLQGAGYINLDNLTKSDVMLTNKESGKGFVYCGASEDNEVSFTLTLKNLSDKDVTYNNIKGLTVRNADEDGYVLFDSTYVKSKFVMDESVTVPANGEIDFPVSVEISDSTREELDSIFENGFFIDGFVTFAGDDVQQISIPFTRFVGDYYKAPIFDGKTYTDENLYSGTNIVYYDNNSGSSMQTEVNPNDERMVVSFNEDENACIDSGKEPSVDFFLLRGAVPFSLTVKNSDDEIIYITSTENVSKYCSLHLGLTGALEDEEEGEYTVSLEAGLNADASGETKESMDFDIYLDNTAPVIESLDYNEEDDAAVVVASDNYGLNYAYIIDDEGNTARADFTEKDGVYSANVDLSELNDDFDLYVYDYAYNYATTAEEAKLPDVSVTYDDEGYYGSTYYRYITITNNGDTPVTVTPILAIYGSDGELLKTVKGEQVKSLTGSKDCTFIAKLTDSAFPNYKIPDDATQRVYLWDSLDGIHPIEYYEEQAS